MSSEQPSRQLASFRRVVHGLGLAALILLLGPHSARADFVTPYAITNFSVVNSAFANGTLQTPDNGKSIVLTGPNDGSGLAGQIDATVICRGAGAIKFRYAYATSDASGFDTGGYVLNGQFQPLASANNVSGTLSVDVNAGDVFGFRVSSVDNTGEAGILTISDVTFPPSTTITSISSSPNPSVFGQAVTLVASVTSAVGVPGGAVVFKDGTATLGSATLNGAGQAQFVTPAFRLGDHAITASYAGTNAFAPSTSTAVTHTVRAGATVTTLSSSSQLSVFGQPVTLTAVVTTAIPGTGVPTGAISFAEGSTQLGTALLNGSGTATLTLPSLTLGSHTLTATYASDGSYLASISAALIQTVNPAATRTVLSSSSITVTKGQSVTFTAAVSVAAPGAGLPTGAVVFKEGGATLSTVNLDSALRSSFTTDSLSAGVHTLTAIYNGDSNFNGSTSTPLAETVNKAPTTTTIGPIAGPALAGVCVTISATVTSQAGIPTGTMAFRNGSSILATPPVNAFGTASATNVCLPIGSYSITAEYQGDGNFLSSTSPGTPFNVEPTPTQVAEPVLRSGNPLAGEALTLEARVTGERSPTGTIRFYDGSTTLGTAPVDRQGLATLTARFGMGLHLVTAFYEGDVMHATSRSEPLFLTIRGVGIVKIVSSANPSQSGAEVVFTATVAPPQGVTIEPTGSVTFMDGTRSLGTSTLKAGQASIRAADLAAGEHAIVGSYAGDANYTPTLSAALNQVVARMPSTTTLEAGVDAEGYFLTAKVACSSGSVAAGAVQFEDVSRSAALGSVMVNNGSATMRLTAPIPVGHRIRGAYQGTAACDGSSSAVLQFIAASNAFSFSSGAFAADAITSIFGEDLTQTTATASSGNPQPGVLGGVTVEILDTTGSRHPAGLYFVSPTQVNFVLPADVAPGPARAVVTNAGTTATLGIVVSRVAPGLASLNGSGSGPAAAYLIRVHADGSQDEPIVVSGTPVAFGSETDQMYAALYGTGFRNSRGSVNCTLNGRPVSTLYSGPHPAYPGLDQINIALPATLRGAGTVAVSCTVEGQTTNTVSIHVE